MATTAPTGERHRTLDIVRGVAVIGILVVNIGDFAMPSAARLNPTAWGGSDPLDLALWGLNWVAFDNKMRGLFSLLFGASLLLVADRARTSGAEGAARQQRRLVILLWLGVAHHLLLWDGDILLLYAVIGMFALPFAALEPRALLRATVTAFGVAFLLGTVVSVAYLLQARGTGGSVLMDGSMNADLTAAARAWPAQVAARTEALLPRFTGSLFSAGVDTFGLMLLGMVLSRSGLLLGRSDDAQARRLATRLAVVGGVPLAALATWLAWSGFPSGWNEFAYFTFAYPFNIALTIAWAAGLSAWASTATGWLARALEATGRAAFTNYIASSLVMTSLFSGYGGGLYGRVDRAEAWLIVLAAAALMLAWSRPWLTRYRYGPLEWVWRSAARGRLQPMAGGALAR